MKAYSSYDDPINRSARNNRKRHTTRLASANTNANDSQIDFILVYKDKHDNDNSDDEENRNRLLNRQRQRENFQQYLTEVQGLQIEEEKSIIDHHIYVKIHTPFEVLLSTAEKIRMKLPIEKIENTSINSERDIASCWYRFTNYFKQPFRLESSSVRDDIDYYTAVYNSSNRKAFETLFENLRGHKNLYFTPSERSLLTYELLSRAHFDDDDSKIPQVPVAKRAALNTLIGLEAQLRRPGITRLIEKNVYECCFPLHESLRDNLSSDVPNSELNDREKLRRYWAALSQIFKFQPLSLVRSYMGEKITFYFALAGYYNQMLILPSIVGLIIFIYGAATVNTDQPASDVCGSYGDSIYMCPRCDKACPFWKLSESCVYIKISYVFDNTATVVFAVLMSLWARWFVEFWKRRQAVLQYDWDSIDFEENLEPIRPEYEEEANKANTTIVNPVTQQHEPHIEMSKRIPYFIVASLVLTVTIGIICATLFATIVYRVQMEYILKRTSVKSYSSVIVTFTSAIMNLICSIILSQLYYWIARKLTDLESHKYQSRYDDALTIKIYLFQFANFYSTLFYIAFFKGRFDDYPSKYGEPSTGDFTEQCDPGGCFVELTIQFFIIMTGKQFANLVVQFFFAIRGTFLRCCRSRAQNKGKKQWEQDKMLEDFESSTLIDEYLELVIQYGFVTLFVVAFPLAPLFALINNLIGTRLDAWKFLSKYKRPVPFKASDIGIWENILSAISYLAVVTNAIVIAWTSEFIPRIVYRTIQATGTSLNGYVAWTLSSFSIADYNQTGSMTSDVPTGLTYCQYRDFRESTGPSYAHTSVYWNVTAARLAFIIVFEHVVFFTVYLIQRLISDIPKDVEDKVSHERYIEQYARWESKKNVEKNDVTDSQQRLYIKIDTPKDDTQSHFEDNTTSPLRKQRKRSKLIRTKVLSDETK